METWWKITLPMHDSGLGGKTHILKDRFARIFMANNATTNAAMFVHNDNPGILYFSPQGFRIASNVLTLFKPVPCRPPREQDVKLVVGAVGTERFFLHSSEAA